MFSPYRSIRIASAIPGLLIVFFLLVEATPFFNILIPFLLRSTTSTQVIFRGIHTLWFFSIYILCWWSYLACVFTHPGPVTPDYLNNYEEEFGCYDLRYCETCACEKPPRCHHCRLCRMCIVNMDHHCPWMCNCIGYLNKKFFVLFLFYAWIGCLDISMSAARAGLPLRSGPSSKTIVSLSLYLLAPMFAFSFAVTLTFFGGFHFWLVFNDKTTIEANQVWRSLLRGSPFSRKKRSYYLNWCKVMDNNPWIWFLPFHSSDFTFSWDFLKTEDEESDSDSDVDVLPSSFQARGANRESAPLLRYNV